MAPNKPNLPLVDLGNMKNSKLDNIWVLKMPFRYMGNLALLLDNHITPLPPVQEKCQINSGIINTYLAVPPSGLFHL